MSVLEATCPACSAPVTFKIKSSLAAICDYCNSVIARTDRGLEDVGKVAEIVNTGSPLAVGQQGSYQGVAFELTGRAQLAHQAGGKWDEWYAAFTDGRWGWIAEAQGRFYVTFARQIDPQKIPPFDYIQVGAPLAGIVGNSSLIIAEKGVAKAVGAKGEIPYRLVPGSQHAYADLSGNNSEFATIDYSEQPPILFVGREVGLDALHIAGVVAKEEEEVVQVQVKKVSCPHCSGPLTLNAPDLAERVTCPNCGSFLDVTQGKLQILDTNRRQPIKPLIPLGSEGEFQGQKLTVIGFMQRSVKVEGVRYPWMEYLLYNPKPGFHWLVVSNNHWTYVKPLPPGVVTEDMGSKKATFGNKKFRLFDYQNAQVEYVEGEFYWKVSVGEMVGAADFVAPPLMLSKEATANELSWSLGTYLKKEDVAKAFGLKADTIPDPIGIAPNQPYLEVAWELPKFWGIFSVVTIVLWIFFAAIASDQEVFTKNYTFPPIMAGATPAPVSSEPTEQPVAPEPSEQTTDPSEPSDQPVAPAESTIKANVIEPGANGTQVVFSEPFNIVGGRNIAIRATSPVDNTWMYLEGDLVNMDTGLVQNFPLEIEYYHGVEGGESWSEGGQGVTQYTSALPPGKYMLRLEAQWERKAQPATVNIEVRQGVVRGWPPILVLLLVGILPVTLLLIKWVFESKRWKDSPYSPYGKSSGGDD